MNESDECVKVRKGERREKGRKVSVLESGKGREAYEGAVERL